MKKILLSICLTISLFLTLSFQKYVYAFEIIDSNIYSEIALNFFEKNYEAKNISYSNLNVELTKNLKDSENDVVGKVVVLKRDDSHDYVLFNIANYQIDEFSLNDSKFYKLKNENLYYSGKNLYKKIESSYYDIEGNIFINQNDFAEECAEITQNFKELKNSTKIFTTDNNPLPMENKNGYNGFYEWSSVYAFNKENEYKNSGFQYLKGVTWSGLSDSNLKFNSQNKFNSYFGTNNSCGPCALTNMFTYFDYTQVKNKNGYCNALVDEDIFSTFDKFRTLTKHSNENGTSTSTYSYALSKYATDQDYNYQLIDNIVSYEEFKNCIKNKMPILASIQLKGWGGHAVLVVGYEEFSKEYQEEHSFMWWKWTTTETKYTRYLRVIDGWSSSNNSRFIDYSGYWDSITGWGVGISE